MAFSWFLAQLKPNARNIAERNLRRQGFETYLPLMRQTERKNNRFVVSSKPMFPGYIFVKVDTRLGGWRSINSTVGVIRLVSFGSAPSVVSEDLIAAIRARSDAVADKDGRDTLAEGDAVRVTGGPFTDFVASVEAVDSENRVWLLLDLLGRQTRVSVSDADVIKKG